MSALFDGIARHGPPLRGIMHAAADPEQPTVILRPMTSERCCARRSTNDFAGSGSPEPPLSTFLFFSSTTALLGAAGLVHYAGANSFLDAFVLAVDTPGRMVLSVNWELGKSCVSLWPIAREAIARVALSRYRSKKLWML